MRPIGLFASRLLIKQYIILNSGYINKLKIHCPEITVRVNCNLKIKICACTSRVLWFVKINYTYIIVESTDSGESSSEEWSCPAPRKVRKVRRRRITRCMTVKQIKVYLYIQSWINIYHVFMSGCTHFKRNINSEGPFCFFICHGWHLFLL